eukprot:TRINITY_DN5944_c0_g3_i2.p2 TRINITY_DN5944_c0_g3~~TRINITY_DN5944_c0_g3_i2.p2  ORF type:complete len:204 (-),score=47.97 TRINITY_DN5944_c0_g3_i2:283-894(-)
MARFFAGAIAICLVSDAAAFTCPPALNVGSVGSCMTTGCAASRGPTDCKWGTCWCKEGYCRYPASTLHVQSRYCVARIPDATCHLTRFCYSGGLTSSFCESGYCMCKFGMHPEKDADGNFQCVASAGELAAAVALNATAVEIQTLLEQQSHSESAVAKNVAMATAWGCVAFAFVMVSAGVVAMKLYKRNTKVHSDSLSESMLG